MAISDYNGVTGGTERLCIVDGSGFSSSGSGTEITGFTDDSGNTTDFTMAQGTGDRPLHGTSPPTGLRSPYCDFTGSAAGDNGFDAQINLTGESQWWVQVAIRYTALSGFNNIFSSSGGASEGSLYTNGSTLTYQEASTETVTTLSTDTDYVILFVYDGTDYIVYIDDDAGTTLTMTPGDEPSILDFHAYGGTGAGHTGYCWSYAVGTGALSAADRTTLYDAAVESRNEESSTEVLAANVTGDTAITAALGRRRSLAANVTGGTVITAITSGGTELVANVTGNTAITADMGVRVAMSANVTGDTDITADLAVAGGTTESLAANVTGNTAITADMGVRVSMAASITGATNAPSGRALEFDGTGAFTDWDETTNGSAIATIGRVSGRYRAEIPAGDQSGTTFFNGDEGRGDYLEVDWSVGTTWTFTAYNVGIGTHADSQAEIADTDDFSFCGIQVNNDLSASTQNSAHMVAGNRGTDAHHTIEGKSTIAGSSSQGDNGDESIGTNITRCNMRITGTNVGGTKSLLFEYSLIGDDDNWQEYDDGTNASGTVGTLPTFADTVYVGLITYGFGFGVAFVGTCDRCTLEHSDDAPSAEWDLSVKDKMAANVAMGTALSAVMGRRRAIAANVTGDTSGAAALSIRTQLATNIIGGTAIAADLTEIQPGSEALAANVTGDTDIVANLGVRVGMVANVQGNSGLVAALGRRRGLGATLTGETALTAVLTSYKRMAATFVGGTAITADLRTGEGFAATVLGATTLAAVLSVRRGLAANITGNTNISASLGGVPIAGYGEVSISQSLSATVTIVSSDPS